MNVASGFESGREPLVVGDRTLLDIPAYVFAPHGHDSRGEAPEDLLDRRGIVGDGDLGGGTGPEACRDGHGDLRPFGAAEVPGMAVAVGDCDDNGRFVAFEDGRRRHGPGILVTHMPRDMMCTGRVGRGDPPSNGRCTRIGLGSRHHAFRLF